MTDDKRSANRVGKPLVFGEIIVSEANYAQALKDAHAAGYAQAIEKLVTWQFRDESELEGESFAVFDGFGGRRGEVYRNVNDKWYCSPTLGREFETMEEARAALCERVAAEIKNIR